MRLIIPPIGFNECVSKFLPLGIGNFVAQNRIFLREFPSVCNSLSSRFPLALETNVEGQKLPAGDLTQYYPATVTSYMRIYSE